MIGAAAIDDDAAGQAGGQDGDADELDSERFHGDFLRLKRCAVRQGRGGFFVSADGRAGRRGRVVIVIWRDIHDAAGQGGGEYEGAGQFQQDAFHGGVSMGDTVCAPVILNLTTLL